MQDASAESKRKAASPFMLLQAFTAVSSASNESEQLNGETSQEARQFVDELL